MSPVQFDLIFFTWPLDTNFYLYKTWSAIKPLHSQCNICIGTSIASKVDAPYHTIAPPISPHVFIHLNTYRTVSIHNHLFAAAFTTFPSHFPVRCSSLASHLGCSLLDFPPGPPLKQSHLVATRECSSCHLMEMVPENQFAV